MERSEREGWTVHSITESLDTSTPHGRFVVTILAGLAQMEREQIGERTRTALAELKRQGKRVSGKPPWGYRFVAGELVEVPEERDIVERIKALRASGLGARRIAHKLDAEGKNNPRTGSRWSPSSVAKILRRT